MDQIAMRNRARVPAVNCGGSASSARLDRHLSVLGGPAAPSRETEEAVRLMRELTTRDAARTGAGRGSHVSLFAPLRRLRRPLLGSGH